MVQKSIDQEKPLYALLFKSYSSQFYSKGKIKVLTPIELENMVKSKKKFSIIIQNRHKSRVSQNIIEKLNPQIIRKNDGLYTIYAIAQDDDNDSDTAYHQIKINNLKLNENLYLVQKFISYIPQQLFIFDARPVVISHSTKTPHNVASPDAG